MDSSLFHLMQRAVDIVGESQHATNKIAATIAGKDAGGEDFALSYNNYWPDAIRDRIGQDVRIGGSSGTVHAETACLINAPMTEDAAMFVTDPPCPNCVKNMAEAGVRALYIDHKGFDKDFAARRGNQVRELSLKICAKAGISVFKIFRKEKRVEPILEIPKDYIPALERPPRVEKITGEIDEHIFRELVRADEKIHDRRNFAAAVARAADGGLFFISAEIHPIAGFTAQDPTEGEGKYDHFLQPVQRVMMNAARLGLRIDKNFLYSSRVPTAREQVNMVGAGLDELHLGDDGAARDERALEALKRLTDAEILRIKKL